MASLLAIVLASMVLAVLPTSTMLPVCPVAAKPAPPLDVEARHMADTPRAGLGKRRAAPLPPQPQQFPTPWRDTAHSGNAFGVESNFILPGVDGPLPTTTLSPQEEQAELIAQFKQLDDYKALSTDELRAVALANLMDLLFFLELSDIDYLAITDDGGVFIADSFEPMDPEIYYDEEANPDGDNAAGDEELRRRRRQAIDTTATGHTPEGAVQSTTCRANLSSSRKTMIDRFLTTIFTSKW